jgi:hypothetical protein
MQVMSGQDVALGGTTLVADPTLRGVVEGDQLINFRHSESGTSGVLQSRVVRVESGTLDFYFRVRSLTGLPLFRVGWNMFGVLSTDIDWRPDGLGDVGPVRVSRRDFPMPGSLPTVSLDFIYLDSLTSGGSGKFVYVKTNATRFERYNGLYAQGDPRPDGTSAWEALFNAFGPSWT